MTQHDEHVTPEEDSVVHASARGHESASGEGDQEFDGDATRIPGLGGGQALPLDDGDTTRIPGMPAPEPSMDLQEEAVTEPRVEEQDDGLLDFREIRPQLEEVIERGDRADALSFLEQLTNFPDATRHIEDNLWLYRTVGELHASFGNQEAALEAYRVAYHFDPRDIDVLRPFIQQLFAQAMHGEALQVMQSMLLYHKRDLRPGELVELYRQMGTCYENQNNLDKAQISYEKALDENQKDSHALAGLLRVVSHGKDSHEVIRVRQRMIRTLSEPEARSMAMIALGDDWIERFNDAPRALDLYEQAFDESSSNRRAIEKISAVSKETGDWRRLTRAYFTLSKMAKTPEEEADWLIKASAVARDKLWEPEKALNGFRRALELDPSRLDAFKVVTSILVDAKDWVGLKDAYVQLLALLQGRPNASPELMVALWQKLGETYKTHLNNKGEAIVAFDQASQYNPRSVELHEQVIGLAEREASYLEFALVHLKALRVLQPQRLEVLERLGKVLIRQNEVDQGFCVFRALDYLGAELGEDAKAFVKKLKKPIYVAPRRALSVDILQKYLFAPDLDRRVSRLFTIVKQGLDKWVGQSPSKYGLRRKDRVRLEGQRAFVSIYRSVGELLEYRTLPEVWQKADQVGLVNGALVPDGMLLGPDLEQGSREKHTAFIVGKQLFLALPPFALAAIRHTDLPAFYMIAKMVAFPERFHKELDGDMLSAYKTLKKATDGEHLAKLQRIVESLVSDGQEPDLEAWVEALEDTANRVGLVFCDDLNVCDEYLREEPQRISRRTPAQRMGALTEFSLTEEYAELRKLLGISVA